ncbi:hypothetical protein ACV56Z_06975 [Staphylococcus aureus]
MVNIVVIIEHNLDVIKTADDIIDLGPEGGAAWRGPVLLLRLGTPTDCSDKVIIYRKVFKRST